MSFHSDYVGVVIDAGSQCTKAGFANESSPRCVTSTTVGRFRRAGLRDGIPSVYVGDEAVKRQGISNLVWPVKEGLINDWDEMEKLWHYIYFKELHVPPEESRMMHTVHALVPIKDKERMAEIMFESFTVQGLYMVKSPVAALHASGRTTGVVWENGFSSSNVTPVFEGFPLEHSTLNFPVTGDLLTDRLQRQMAKSGYSFTTPVERSIMECIKAEMCYVSQDYNAEVELYASSGDNKSRFDLPDGQHVLLGGERFKCPECIFQPSLEGLNSPGLVDLICSSISKCEVDHRPLFYNNVVVSGGSSMFPGLVNRLSFDLKMRMRRSSGISVNIDELPSRQLAVWAGASLLASMDQLKGFWMTREQYQDTGPEGVYYKFF